MKIALLQMNSGIDPVANLAWLDTHIGDAAAAGAVMVFAPEMSVLLDSDAARSAPHVVPEAQSAMLSGMRESCARHRIWLHSGSIPVQSERDSALRANRSHIIDDMGNIVTRYDKIHLFDVDLPGGESWRESSRFARGERAVVCDTPVGRLGLAICFDLRFPALFGKLVDKGAEVIAVPAAFTVSTGKAHWEILLRARAIETGCFVIASAQCGHHGDGRKTYGHAMVIDPWGQVLCDVNDEIGMRIVELDSEIRTTARAAIPMIRNRTSFH